MTEENKTVSTEETVAEEPVAKLPKYNVVSK